MVYHVTMTNKKLLTLQQACYFLSISPSTIKRWEQDGIVNPIRMTPKSPRRYDKDEIMKLVNKRGELV